MWELKQEGIDDIGFIDPNTVNGHVVRNYAKDTETLLEEYLEALMNTKRTIIFPYNMG